ncbi:DMT family transporter [Mammaliicoccus sciuri]|uniref:DMT family transporter n=1 Tax=Mammaliicoccus sciuri TaxID=1296 RepID=UPI00132FEFB6|nr:DMT family transporter [Mammaliicoccus sciuri]MCJ1747958.1 DMT family transporter [Mammaliicoccus sciuri]
MKKYLLLFLLSLIWGSQFLFVALITHDANPVIISFIKALLGAVFLWVITLFLKKTVYQKQYGLYVLIALFEVVLPFIFIAQGQRFIASGITSIIIALTPIFTLLIMVLTVQKKLKILESFAIFLGFIGIVVISWTPQQLNMQSYISIGLLLFASLSFAISLVLMQNLKSNAPIHHMKNILFIASGMLLLLLIIIPNTIDIKFDLYQWGALVILGVVHAALAFVLYNILVNKYDALYASLSNYIVPVIGVLIGFIVLNESLYVNTIIGIILVLISLILSQIGGDKTKEI